MEDEDKGMESTPINSVKDFLAKVEYHTKQKHWDMPNNVFKPWFRGQSNSKNKLLPYVLREEIYKEEYNTANITARIMIIDIRTIF